MDRDLFERIKPFVTIYGSGRINVNVAPREVLHCVAVFKGADRLQAERAVDEIIKVRPKAKLSDFHQELSEADNRILRSMMGMLTVTSTCFGGTAVGRAGNARAGPGRADIAESRIAFVLDADGREQYWHEH